MTGEQGKKKNTKEKTQQLPTFILTAKIVIISVFKADRPPNTTKWCNTF